MIKTSPCGSTDTFFFTVQISIKKAGYMDVKQVTSPVVYVDMLAGDRSILRTVFGITSRAFPPCFDIYFCFVDHIGFLYMFLTAMSCFQGRKTSIV